MWRTEALSRAAGFALKPAVLTLCVLGAGCGLAPRTNQDGTMPTTEALLLGHWEKVSNSPCSRPYPHTLDFRSDGTYRGWPENSGTTTLWDVGSFVLHGSASIRMSLANDAERDYTIEVDRDLLEFVDSDGCTFRYRRITPP